LPEFVKSFVGHSRKITGLGQLTGEKKFFVSASTDKSLLLWDITNEEKKIVYSSKTEIKSLITFQDEIYLVEGRNIKIVNPLTKKNKTVFKTSSTITCSDCFYDEANKNLFFSIGTSEGEIIILSGKNHKKIRSYADTRIRGVWWGGFITPPHPNKPELHKFFRYCFPMVF